MSVTLWKSAFQLFASVNTSANGDTWLRSKIAQTGDPVIIDALTPAGATSSSTVDDIIYAQPENWVGDVQAPIEVATTGNVTLPFEDFSAGAVASSNNSVSDAVLWWSAPAINGPRSYDLYFQLLSDTPLAVNSLTPALTTVGPLTSLNYFQVDPLSTVFASSGSAVAVAFATADTASPGYEYLNLEVYSTSGVRQSFQTTLDHTPTSTVYGVIYSGGPQPFEFFEAATVNGVQGFKFSPASYSTNTLPMLGAATFQAVAFTAPGTPAGDAMAIDDVGFSPLDNGDLLEFVSYHDTASGSTWRGVETRLLDSSLQDITASTASFVSGGFSGQQSGAAHWSHATLANGDTILIYTLNGAVTIEQFDANGNLQGTYPLNLMSPSAQVQQSALLQTALPSTIALASQRLAAGGVTINGGIPGIYSGAATDFDSIIAMGSRFEVTYRVGGSVEAVIYDTATQGVAFTIDDKGASGNLWAGTPFDDTVTYGAGINEVGGGGGTDTFVATNFYYSQIGVSVNAAGQTVFKVDAGDIDTLENFSTIRLADGVVSIQNGKLVATALDGSALDHAFSAPGGEDFNGDGKADILWRNADGEVWLSSSNGSGGLNNQDLGLVDGAWTIAAVGDFNGDGKSDIFWRNASGDVQVWNALPGGGFAGQDLGTIGTDWVIDGVADFNGDGKADIVWRNAGGDVQIWNSLASGGYAGQDLGVVAPSWRLVGAGDFNGDGKADLLWRNDNGDVQVWNALSAGGFAGHDLGVIGNDWRVAGIGDFNGDGKADILWRNAGGDTQIWNSLPSGGFAGQDLGVIGPDWHVAAVGDFNGDGFADILWRNDSGDAQVWNSSRTGFTGQDLGVVTTTLAVQG